MDPPARGSPQRPPARPEYMYGGRGVLIRSLSTPSTPPDIYDRTDTQLLHRLYIERQCRVSRALLRTSLLAELRAVKRNISLNDTLAQRTVTNSSTEK